jgi:Domain of unknown function (DUF4372)
MHIGNLVFSQLMEFAPWHTFRRLVAKYRGDFNVRTFSCLDQFLSMAFAQLTYRESLRDIEACLRAQPIKLYHLRGKVSRSALADANESRDWRIYAEFAHALIRTARRLYAQEPLEWISPRRSTPWMPPPSTCACRCFRGPSFAKPKRR